MRASSDIFETVSETEVGALLKECRSLVEERLEVLVPTAAVEPASVHGAIRWSLLAGGKRFRPALLLATGRTFRATDDMLLDTACALEMVHTYSLIHDDLPAMDDDELRRGRPTCHVRFGEAIAILAGDVLQTLAFETIASDERLPAEVRVRLLAEVARAAGTPDGMVAGQAYDLAAESREVTGAELERIHRHKTGALIVAAARCGAIIAGASREALEAVTRYASALGLLFQITDDLLDVTASAEDLGKTPGKDARSQKATYPSVYGLETARARAQSAYEEARSVLAGLNEPAPVLAALAEYILRRRQ